METWKIQIVVVTFCVLVQTSKGSTSGAEDGRRLSRRWQDESVDTSPADSLMKRSKALRFYGLMGKRAVTKKPFQVKRRNKGVAFVSLMGRSEESVSGANPSAATRGTQHPEQPSQQGSLKEWIQFLY